MKCFKKMLKTLSFVSVYLFLFVYFHWFFLLLLLLNVSNAYWKRLIIHNRIISNYHVKKNKIPYIFQCSFEMNVINIICNFV